MTKKGDSWFTSDTHFGHANIIEYCSETRPFATIDEHDEAIETYWNETVAPDDTVYFLGDFLMGHDKAERMLEIAPRLHGKKIAVLGNHDICKPHVYIEVFDWFGGAREFRGLGPDFLYRRSLNLYLGKRIEEHDEVGNVGSHRNSVLRDFDDDLDS